MWEYMTVDQLDLAQLNDLGAQGWEVVGVLGQTAPGVSRARGSNVILLKRATS